MPKKQTLTSVTISSEHSGLEIATYLKEVLGVSNRQAQRIVRTKGLILNGRVVHSKTKLQAGDDLQLRLPQGEQVKIQTASPHELTILYEDSWLLGVEKPAGLLTYDLRGQKGLANQVAGYYLSQGQQLTPRPLHRLDTPTSGVVVFSKDAATQTSMNELWSANEVKRFYWALCEGEITRPLELNTPLGNVPACTKVEPLKVYPNFTELKVELITGRTHQIRRHLAEINHPLLGDRRYGRSNQKSARLALHASCVRFPHPQNNGALVEITSPIPFKEFWGLTNSQLL